MRSRARARAATALVGVAACMLLGGCSIWSGESGGSSGTSAAPTGFSTGPRATTIQSSAHTAKGPAWRSDGVSFVLPAGWSVFSGADVVASPVAMASVREISSRSGLDSDRFAATLASYHQVGLGPDDGLVILTTIPQADQDATTRASVDEYLAALCQRQPTMCEHLVSFERRSTPQGETVVYVTVNDTGYYSGNVLLPYLDRGAGSVTPQGRRLGIGSSSSAMVDACIEAVLGSVRQS